MLKFLRNKLLNPVLANQKEMLIKLNILYEYAVEQKWSWGGGENITFENAYTKSRFERPLSCTSQICNQEFYGLPFFQYWSDKLKEKPHFHRKLWEFVYIAQVLYENGFLRDGNRGLCFGVGTEPLPALFASMGCEITATDMDITSDIAEKYGSAFGKQYRSVESKSYMPA
jgi:hypothetical protein